MAVSRSGVMLRYGPTVSLRISLGPARLGCFPRDLLLPLRAELRCPDHAALRPAELPARDPLRVLRRLVAQRLGVRTLGDRSYDVRDGLRSLVRVTRELPLDRRHGPNPCPVTIAKMTVP